MSLPAPTASALDAALALGLRGWRTCWVHTLLPSGCSCGRDECGASTAKHPVVTAWQKSATADPDELRNSRARLRFEPNVGLVLGEQPSGEYLVAVDVDDPARLAALPTLPESQRVESGRGYRMLYTLPSGVPLDRLRNRTGLGGEKGIDVKVRNGQIVVHGQHQDGTHRYHFARATPIAELPAAWVELLLDDPKPPPFVREYTPQTLKADAKAKHRADRYLETAVRAEAARLSRQPEGGRNDFLHKRAVSLLSLCQGMHLPSAWGYVLRELAAAGAACGLPENETRRTLASAERFVVESGAARYPIALEHVSSEPSTPAPVVQPTHALLQHRGSAAGIAVNVARLLAREDAWRGGPSLDTYIDAIVWPAPLPEPISRIARSGVSLCKSDLAAVQGWCLERGLHAGLDAIEQGVRLAAAERHTDSLQAYVRALPRWDGSPRLLRWLPVYLGTTDDEYHRVTGRAWLLAAIERALRPGLLVDIVPILEGPQRVGKNRALSILFGAHLATLGKFDPDALALKRLATCRWCIHDDEFKGRGPRALDSLKSWVSQTEETYLAKYENDLTTRPRRALLACSTNASQYLHDDTGNLRFVTWAVARLDHVGLARDREQLWAEALAAVDAGASWRDGLDALRPISEAVAAEREVVDPLGEQLLGLVLSGAWRDQRTSAALTALLGMTDRSGDQTWATRLGEAVRHIGGTTGRCDVGRAKVRWYGPPDLTGQGVGGKDE